MSSNTAEAEMQGLQRTLDSQCPGLEQISHCSASHAWLKPALSSDKGTDEFLTEMERRIQQDSYLAQLQNAAPSAPPLPGGGKFDVCDSTWWKVTGPESESSQVAQQELESYVVVEREDVLEAIGAFVAAYLATLPEAQNMEPKQLQRALVQAFQELRRGPTQNMWRYGQSIYRCAAVTYGAFSLYTNPWLVRAVLAAIWTASRILTGLL